MQVPVPSVRMVCFGIYEVDLRSGELRKNGIKLKLQDQSFQILRTLLEHPGEIVSREELQRQLWPADTFVDFEHGLNTAVKRLRDALSDSADNPRFLETVTRRGYRFIAPVSSAAQTRSAEQRQTSAAIDLPHEAAVSGRTAKSERHLRWYLLLIALAIVAAAFLVQWRVKRGASYLAVEKRITANPVEAPIRAAVVSPDGKYVAYADPTGAYLRQIDSGETRPLPLPKDFNAAPSSWFPDSIHLLVTSHLGSERTASIWKISILGGTPQMLAADAEEGSVSPDGSQIAFFRRIFVAAVNHPIGPLWIMASNGENPHKFAEPTATDLMEPGYTGTEIWAVSWAPGGRRIAYVEQHRNFATNAAEDWYWLLTRDLTGGQSQVVLKDHGISPAALCWARDGRLLYGRMDPKNEHTDYGVWALRVDPSTGNAKGSPESVSFGLGGIGGLSVTADESRLVLWRGNTRPQVFVSEFDKGTRRLTTPRRLTMDENANVPTAWTPDSNSILFFSNRNGFVQLFKQKTDQSIAEVIVEGRRLGNALPRLNPDGSKVLFTELSSPYDASLPIRLMSMPLSGGTPSLVLEDHGIANFLCARTPSRICVLQRVLGKTSSFITFDTERGKGHEIARLDGLLNWGLSPNGSLLAVVTDENRGRLRFFSLDTAATRDVVLKEFPVLKGVDWTADGGSALSVSVAPSGTSVVLEVDLKGNARVLLESDLHTRFRWAIPSPDGRYVALNVFTGENNVWMVENF